VRDDSPISGFILTALFVSIVAVGGVNAVLPELHRQVVEINHWLTDKQFADMFAIANASPGPNMLIITLIGWSLGGFYGAILSTLALCTPTCALTYLVAQAWEKFKDAPWRIAVQAGLVPVTVGLIAASAYLLARDGTVTTTTQQGVYQLVKYEQAAYAVFELRDISLASPLRLHFNKMDR